MLQQERAEDFVIATGVAVSLRKFVDLVFNSLDLDADEFVETEKNLYRPSDISWGQGDASRAYERLGWAPQVKMPQLASRLVEEIRQISIN